MKGILIGFAMAVPVGPIGIMCIRKTLTEGRLRGMIIGLGAATADLSMITKMDEESLPKEFSLSQNYPNPFNPTTSFSYEIQIKSDVVIKVYNVLGKEVAELLNGEKLPGRYQIEFNAPYLPSGVYFYSINAGSYKRIIKKMILLK